MLIIFSYLYCLSFGLAGVIVLTLVAMADFVIGLKVGSLRDNKTQRLWLYIGVTANLAPLALCKYSAFAARSASMLLHPLGLRFTVPETPVFSIVGVSYFTFAGISYLLDIYFGKIEPSHSASEYICYLAYFPKIIAGPIVRAGEFLPQLRSGLQVTAQDVEVGCAYLLVGFVKKLVIADQLAGHVGMIMATPKNYTAFTLVQGAVGYAAQIYADFSGYSDIAIGCARLMAIKFPQNFMMPYSSVNIAEFWRRWHITMSTWFREYVFLPLELNSRDTANPRLRVSRNLIITMLLCGLWHGPSWNFVVWGGFHGVALAIYQLYASRRGPKRSRQRLSVFHPNALAARAMTLSVVVVSYVFFGTQSLSSAWTYLWRIFTWNRGGIALDSPYIVPLVAVVVLAHLVINKDRNVVEELVNCSVVMRTVAYASLLFILGSLVTSETAPFVYVRF